ncbi:aspartate/glutamate racemase family protein [Aspergillus undulatus]|uniref:aspartate/glutamate racemase family protein n=1 Tax=Aspergillus undulatus TaxID=1810928 RepID=UPI003CCD5053
MKIMLLIPLPSPEADYDPATLKSWKDPSTHLTVTTLNPSVGPINSLETQSDEALVARDIIRATYQASKEGYNALIIDCFNDPALQAARQVAGDMLVVGPCQSSFETASRLASRYTVIIGYEFWKYATIRLLRGYGHHTDAVSFRAIEMGVEEMLNYPDETCDRIIAQSKVAVEKDGAEAIILGCTAESGYHEKIQGEVGLPVIDPIIAALKTAEFAGGGKVQSGWGTSRRGERVAAADEERLFRVPYTFGARLDVE